MAEQFVNGSRTPYLLNSACLATDTVLTLQGTQGMPATGTFRCQLGYEIVQVTAVNSPLPNQVTVVRGSEGSIAAPQPAGTPFQPCLSAAGMAQFKSDILVAAGVAPTTVVALSSYAPTATQQSIQLYAYSTPGDGGGGLFVWNATDTRTADGGTIIAVTGIATGRWIRVYSGPLDPRWFGADQTGVADSTSAFVSTHAALPANGGEIILVDSTAYKISNVPFTKPVRLHFGRTVLAQASGSSGSMISTNANLTIDGHSQNDSLFQPATGCTGVALSGAFSLVDYGTPSFICERVGFVGGAYGIDTNGLTSPTFGGGIFVVEHCRFTAQSQIGMRVKDGTFFTFVRKVVADTCGAAGIWIGNDTETKLSECTLINSATGPGLVLAGVHHVTVSESEFYGTAGSSEPDILLYGTSGGQGICDIVRNKFGSERTYVPVSARRNIVIDSPDSPAVETDIYRIEQNRFYATRGVLLASISRTSNVGHATVDLTALGFSDMGLQTGDTVWIMGSAGGDALAALSGGPFTITRTSASTFTWASTGSDETAELGAGFVFLANSAAITHATPIGRATYDGNYFDGYGACVDDTADITEQIRDTSGRCVWTDTNTMVGPLGLACQEFLSGGRQFSVVRPTANSPQLSFGADARPNETPGIRNRITQGSEDLTTWGALNITSVTTGITDPFGGTRACRVLRAGVSQVITNIVTPTMGEGMSSGTLDTTGSPKVGFVSVWARKGATSCGTLLVWLQTTNTFPMFESLSLGSDWKRYRLPFVWPPGGDGAMSLRTCPGGEDAMPVDADYFGFQVDDYGGDYLPAVNGSASNDSATGNRWERGIIAAAGLRAYLSGTAIASILGASGDFIALGLHAASAGALRIANAVGLSARNAANSADINLAKTDSSNNVILGEDTNGAETFVDAVTALVFRLGSTQQGFFGSTGFQWQPGGLNTYKEVPRTGAVNTQNNANIRTVATKNTVSSSAQGAYTYTLASGHCVTVTGRWAARQTGSITATSGGTFTATVFNNAGTLTIGSVTTVASYNLGAGGAAAAAPITLTDAGSGNLAINVVAQASSSTDWQIALEFVDN